jgi:hypothetical protein
MKGGRFGWVLGHIDGGFEIINTVGIHLLKALASIVLWQASIMLET